VQKTLGLFPTESSQSGLRITFDVPEGVMRFEWFESAGTSPRLLAIGHLRPALALGSFWNVLEWEVEHQGRRETDGCMSMAASVTALVKRIGKQFPLPAAPEIGFVLDVAKGSFQSGQFHRVQSNSTLGWQKILGRMIRHWATLMESFIPEGSPTPQGIGRETLRRVIHTTVAMPATQPPADIENLGSGEALKVILEMVKGHIELEWRNGAGHKRAVGIVRCSGLNELRWEMTADGASPADQQIVLTTHQRQSIRAQLRVWQVRFPVANHFVTPVTVQTDRATAKPVRTELPPFDRHESPWEWIEDNIEKMAETVRVRFSPFGRMLDELDPMTRAALVREDQRLHRQEERRAQEEQRRRETLARIAEKRRRKEELAREKGRAATARSSEPTLRSSGQPGQSPATPLARNVAARSPTPDVPVHLELPEIAFQECALPAVSLRSWRLTEQAMRWWISNQSDDLLALPYCRIQKLDYQIRTALRVMGALRGRALLSDEVGLGKTIEAGLVLKEWLMRGMVKRFLVLTVPSLIDQWEEELNDKFNLTVATTNQAAARSEANRFWRDNLGIVASLHTLKQPGHLAIAREVHWDLIVVDEAHYLRNRESQAWQAVNALPRQFLLLLTATPVQNSLEELYNLVTLLQPGQLPTPKEFRARFFDARKPRQPREPEELRRLLRQVMIRNTRASSGVDLPPRRAETVLFEPTADEREFWGAWETALRTELARLPASQASLWGRLLLQSGGSSPAAWRSALEKFPNSAVAAEWRATALLETSWRRKVDLLPSMTRVEGGLVLFTQFLDTQAALAEALRAARVEVFVVNGSTPPAQRQPITEEFRKRGGALLLTHSGTEGRNLQFCHHLVNFDLPWNPMEIEQRIGRLHRLGQKHPVRIYNLVQAGTLQEHLLQILQEKLNLFELVVGETGLVLGERFGSDEFADEVLRCWRESEGRVGEALQALGDELAAARDVYREVKQLDATLFAQDYETA
jgi:superfamily II DNA or RNA helicase